MADSIKQNQPFLRIKPMKSFIPILILNLFFCLLVNGQDSTHISFSLMQQNGQIQFQFFNTEIFDEKVQARIEKGVIVGIEHHIRFWENQRVFDEVMVEKVIRIKIQYDHWEESYHIRTSKGDSCIVNDLNTQSSCLFLSMGLIDTVHLEKNKIYFASVESILHPISLDNFSEINQWVQSEVTGLDPKKIKNVNTTGKSISGWFLKMLMNVSGFGDKISKTRTPMFQWQRGQIHWLERQ